MQQNISIKEEQYIKAIYILSEYSKEQKAVATRAIAKKLGNSAPAVTDMLRRLREKEFIVYNKYKGVNLTNIGSQIAKQLVRRHRLWETFMVEKLHISWADVHTTAEQLEHIKSDELIEQLEAFLGYPRFDPHGEPIPDKNGNYTFRNQILLANLGVGKSAIIVGVDEQSSEFLQYLQHVGIGINTPISIRKKYEFDQSMVVLINHSKEITLSNKVAQSIFIDPLLLAL
jgi:DtxR family Mn-dependent transcriptional regulator